MQMCTAQQRMQCLPSAKVTIDVNKQEFAMTYLFHLECVLPGTGILYPNI